MAFSSFLFSTGFKIAEQSRGKRGASQTGFQLLSASSILKECNHGNHSSLSIKEGSSSLSSSQCNQARISCHLLQKSVIARHSGQASLSADLLSSYPCTTQTSSRSDQQPSPRYCRSAVAPIDTSHIDLNISTVTIIIM